MGYWSAYTVVVTGCTIETQFNRTYNLTVRGNTSGRCGWSTDGDDGGFSSSLVQQVFSGTDVWRFAVFDSGSGIGATWGDTAFTDCRTGFVLALAGSSSPLGGTPIATVTPAGTWTSCGQDSSGTLIGEGLSGGMESAPQGVSPTAEPLRDRCINLLSRTEYRGGCGGWTCRHGCQLGLKAVPGGECQTCESYAVDPDFEGQGPSGWLK